MLQKSCLRNSNRQIFLLVFVICFTIFIFTNDGHRYTFDEDISHQQSYRIATFENDPSYIQGESRVFFEYPWLYPHDSHNYLGRSICQNGILCSGAFIFHSVTQVPLIFLNQNFNFISNDMQLTSEDFDDLHYIHWRNQINPDFVFVELFYGPLFTSLSVAVFFLILRSFEISSKNAVYLSFFYGLTTMAWAYSQTSLSSPPMIFFVLLGFYFLKNWEIHNHPRYLILSGFCLGLGFLTRNDSILFIIPIFLFTLYFIKSRKNKIQSFVGFVIPLISAYGIHHLIQNIRFGSSSVTVGDTVSGIVSGGNSNPVLMNIFGLFFSPGVGLFTFSPILLGVFVGFVDLYKKNKQSCILILAFLAMFVFTFGPLNFWHGLNGWGSRYLLPLIPFLLIPLAFSFEKRGKLFKLILLVLGAIGFFINLVYLLQDTHWFVWGFLGDDSRGLYSLGRRDDGSVFPIWINPLVIWSFEYNQLTQSVLWFFNKLQLDIFLLKFLGTYTYIVAFCSILSVPIYFLFRIIYLKTKKSIKKTLS
jgi:hypothetical protein